MFCGALYPGDGTSGWDLYMRSRKGCLPRPRPPAPPSPTTAHSELFGEIRLCPYTLAPMGWSSHPLSLLPLHRRPQGCCPRRVVVQSTSLVEILDSNSAPASTGPPTLLHGAPSISAFGVTLAASGPGPGPGRKPPLLALDLTVSKEGSRFVYSTPPPTIISKVMALFDAAICEWGGAGGLGCWEVERGRGMKSNSTREAGRGWTVRTRGWTAGEREGRMVGSGSAVDSFSRERRRSLGGAACSVCRVLAVFSRLRPRVGVTKSACCCCVADAP
jgi:hypothetical protein